MVHTKLVCIFVCEFGLPKDDRTGQSRRPSEGEGPQGIACVRPDESPQQLAVSSSRKGPIQVRKNISARPILSITEE